MTNQEEKPDIDVLLDRIWAARNDFNCRATSSSRSANTVLLTRAQVWLLAYNATGDRSYIDFFSPDGPRVFGLRIACAEPNPRNEEPTNLPAVGRIEF